MWTNTLALCSLVAYLGSIVVLWKTMRAAERQMERTSKPVVSLVRKNWKLAEEEILQPQQFAEVVIPLRMRNVGNGTALEVLWRFKTEAGHVLIQGMVPHLQPGRLAKTGLDDKQLGLRMGVSLIFECEYFSISDDRYRSTAKLQWLKIVEFNVTKLSS